MDLPKMLQARTRRAASLTFWRGVSPDAQRLMLATMILSSLALGVENVARTLFVLRLDLGTEFFGTFNSFRAFGFMGMAVPAGMLSRRIGIRNTMLLGSVLFLAGYVGGQLGRDPASCALESVRAGYELDVDRGLCHVFGKRLSGHHVNHSAPQPLQDLRGGQCSA